MDFVFSKINVSRRPACWGPQGKNTLRAPEIVGEGKKQEAHTIRIYNV
jgi:hypothetical protein